MAITPLPAAPEPTDSTAEFNSKAFAWVAALDTFTTQANATGVQADASKDAAAASATNSANSATASAASATASASSASAALTHASAAAANTNAPLWVSGTTYAAGALVYSALDGRTYRRKTAGAGTTNPMSDSTNWTPLFLEISTQRPTIRPSLLLDFANSKRLDSRITYARASTATYYGTRTAKAEENLLLYSQEFDNAYWAKTFGTITANNAVAPDGTTTADTFTTNDANGRIERGTIPLVSGQSYTISAWLRRVSGTGNVVFLSTLGFDTSPALSLTSTWTRFSFTFTSASSGNSTIRPCQLATSGDVIEIWGAQLEQRSTVTAYTPTTTQPITNYVPVLETAASNVARFDHNPTTFESLGLLIEEQRTNLVLRSEELNVSPWTQTSVTVSANQIIAPDGTLTGDKIISTSGNIGTIRQSSITVTNGAPYTLSCIAKAGEHNSLVIFITDGVTARVATLNLLTGVVSDVSSGLTTTVTQLGNGWYRFSGSVASSGSTSISLRLGSTQTGDGYSGIYIWGAQLEAGAFATSYIPTVASQVTRAADSASMTGTNFTSWYNAAEGTLYVEATKLDSSTNRFTAGIGFSSTQYIGMLFSTGSGNTFIQPSVGSFGTVVYNNTSFVKAGVGYKTGDYITSINGTNAISSSTAPVPTGAVGTLYLGTTGFSPSTITTSYFKKLSYYPIRLSNTNLQALTG